MRRTCLHLLSIFFFSVLSAYSQYGTLSWQEQSSLLTAPPTAWRYGFYGFGNTALMAANPEFDLAMIFSSRPTFSQRAGQWGMSAMIPSGVLPFSQGIGFIRTGFDSVAVVDWRYSLAFGSRTGGFGIAYGWSTGDDSLFRRSGLLSFSMFNRLGDGISYGLTRNQPLRDFAQAENVVELALRPLGSYPLNIYGDISFKDNDPGIKNYAYSVGAILEPFEGLRLNGRYFSTKRFSLGVDIGFRNAGIGIQQQFDEKSNQDFRAYSVHLGATDRDVNFFTKAAMNNYIALPLGGMKYQRYRFFDNSRTLLETLEALEEVRKDVTVKGMVLNCSGMNISDEMMWELRERLRLIRESGKNVVIYLDRADLSDYYFASVANKIVLDPVGGLYLTGYASGRTYMKRMLEKVGLGYDELRFFKYKSAAEGFARENMSEGEREQRAELLHDRYELVRDGICAFRSLSKASFDSIVNNHLGILPQQARMLGLVDTLARFDDLNELIHHWDNGVVRPLASLDVYNRPADEQWGSEPTIAVIYAIGACAMDGGINARSLVRDVERAAESPTVKAIVLRVDSPGGDPLASDLIAKALLRAKKNNKPVIVSQGSVAASGGYWLSMYADTIVAAPNTITGSIGVISSWFYTKWLADTLGLNYDLIKFGTHSDLGLGPDFMGLVSFPARGYTPEERSIREREIVSMYHDFVAKVASGRKRDTASIAAIAQGRVWSGTDGKTNGLVDVLGGLWDAIEIAKTRAGISGKVEILEMPEAKMFDLNQFMPKLIGVSAPVTTNTPAMDLLKFRLNNNGRALMMLPFDWDEELTK